MKKVSFLIVLLLLGNGLLFSQVAINNDRTTAHPSAGLDIKFPNKGVLLPRLNHEALFTIPEPAEGLMAYCTDCRLDGFGTLVIYIGGVWCKFSADCLNPLSPAAGTHVASPTQIVWNWSTVSGATGYKWNITNNYASATDMGTSTTQTETGLTCGTGYIRYAWAYNGCGYSTPVSLTQTTLSCSTCGSFTINHVAGAVAPVNKTVPYYTVTLIPGETSKCWISSNLGSSHQAMGKDDATEASAGWYWQFNRKQGYKHDGTTMTPNTGWLVSINESFDWLSDNDPCTIELGPVWRMPTMTEWTNVDAGGNWTDWLSTRNSDLKLHAAGYVSRGMTGNTVNYRGSKGYYWSSTQNSTDGGWALSFTSESSTVSNNGKVFGYTLRCLKDAASSSTTPTVTTTAITNIIQATATSGGNVTSDGGATVTTRGVCWSTTQNPTTANSCTTDGGGTGNFVSNLTGLTPNTLYYVRAYASNSVGTAYGNELAFTTLTLPTVTTAAVSNITNTTATSGGNVTSDGGATVTARGVCWSTTQNPTTANYHTANGSGTGSFTIPLFFLTLGTIYYVRAYATNIVGTSYGNQVSFTTLATCGSLTINHVAGDVAPVTKMVTYGTVTNIPGELLKCWITSNLGADHQDTAVNDATEASAGWYWQFNRKQGYKHDGTTRTPNSTWITSIVENSDWVAANDPCAIELGNVWRIPTKTEWINVNAGGNWTNWLGPWTSGLKLHAAGYLTGSDGSLMERGSYGFYWSSTQGGNVLSGWVMVFSSGTSGITEIGIMKTYGFTLRCLR